MNCLASALVILAFCYLRVVSGRPSSDDELLLVHVLFRHGNRVPINSGYANNPISNESFYSPYGYGQLTNKGKETEYKIGTTLRKRYDSFLGKIWNVDYLESRTTDTDRTKMSLELVLAGLWPPALEQKWKLFFNWQPIPFNYETQDKELQGVRVCPKYNRLYNELKNSAPMKRLLSVHNEVYDYLSNQTGEEFRDIDEVWELYFNLLTQQEFGYPLEEWTKEVFPGKMEKIAKDYYYVHTNNTELKKFGAGYFIKKIIQDSKAKIDETIDPETRKMFLYSAHEWNIAYLLRTLGVYDDKIPPYGSHVIIELRLINDIYGFKFYYQDWSNDDPKLLVIPNCEEFCPYSDFVSIAEEIIPNEFSCQ